VAIPSSTFRQMAASDQDAFQSPSERAKLPFIWTFLKFVFAGPLVVVGGGLLVFASVMGSDAKYAVAPAVICLVVAATIASTKNRAVLTVAFVLAGAFCVLVWLALTFIGAAIYSR
jgi:hypothetical protein